MSSIRSRAATALLVVCAFAASTASWASREAPLGAADDADLYVTKDDGAVRALPSREVEYVVTCGNSGPGDAYGVRVLDLPPVELEDVTWRCTASVGARCGGDPSLLGEATGTGAIDELVDLPAGGEVVFTIRGTLAPGADGLLSNRASIQPPAGVTDPHPGNNEARDSDVVLRPFRVTKEVSGHFVPGGTVDYVITVVNQTSIPQPDNPGPELEDDLPPEIEGIAIEASHGTATLGGDGHRIEWNGAIPAFGTLVLTIEGVIAPEAGGRTVSNRGRLNFSLILDPSTDELGQGATNDGLAYSEDPVTGGPTVFRVLGVLDVPTLHTLGLLLLAGLLGAAAVALIARG